VAIFKYKVEKGEVVARLFQDDEKIPTGWKDSPKEAGAKKSVEKKK
tara:strand:- start:545 stop:682 length:138 start_codon:yes stop_codon:yes gene_type:complete